jgi:hypothetical protein
MEVNKGFPFFEEIGMIFIHFYNFCKNFHIQGSMMYNTEAGGYS